MKTLDENDPRLTAYALDELDMTERELVEAYLSAHPAALRVIEEIRETAALLRREFGSGPALVLAKEQREAVLGNAGGVAAEEKIVRPPAFSRVSRILGIAAVAACLGLVTIVGMREYLEKEKHPPMAASEEAGEVELPSSKAAEAKDMAAKPIGGKEEGEDRVEIPETSRLKEKRESAQPADPFSAGGDAPPAPRGAVASAPAASPTPEEFSQEEIDKAGAETIAGTMDEKRRAEPPALRGAVARDALEPESTSTTAPGIAPKAQPSRDKGAAAGLPALPDTDAAPMPEGDRARNLASDSFGDGFGGAGRGEGSSYFGSPGEAPSTEAEIAGSRPSALESSRVANPLPKAAGSDEAKMDEADPLTGRRRFAPLVPEARLDVTGENYAPLIDNPFVSTLAINLSTFSIDVDNAAYSNIRRLVTRNHQLPPKDAVRIEEMVNYFDYDYPQPADGRPFSVNLEVASCPWEKEARLVRIGLKGLEMHPDKRPPSNLVFLIDVSGSMSSDDKLPLLQSAMMALVDALNEDDSIAIVVYAGSSGLVLDSTSGDLKGKIREALAKLQSGGSTNGGEGIELAYATAKRHFIEGGVNRVVLATDGDFNVGTTNHDDLVAMVGKSAKEDGVFLTVLGFGQGNLNDHLMEQLADKGNGNYFYIDNGNEGRRVLVDRLSATLVTIAKDVKIQVDFNPAKVARYRLIGYANRMMANRDFADDTKDAGEIGAGHTVTALYQVVPAGPGKVIAEDDPEREASKYLRKEGDGVDQALVLVPSDELLTVSLRYKDPNAAESEKFEVGLVDPGTRWEESGGDFRFAASVAGYGMLLRASDNRGLLNYDLVLELAEEGKGSDPHGLRSEFIDLVKASKELAGQGE